MSFSRVGDANWRLIKGGTALVRVRLDGEDVRVEADPALCERLRGRHAHVTQVEGEGRGT